MINKLSDYQKLDLSYSETLVLPLHIILVLPLLINKWYNEVITK